MRPTSRPVLCRKCGYPEAPFKHHDRNCPNQPEGQFSLAQYLVQESISHGLMTPPGSYVTAEDIFDWMWGHIVERAALGNRTPPSA